MRILLVGSYRYEMYAPAFSYGFRQLGHEVVEIDYQQYHLKGSSLFASLFNRIQDRYHYGIKMHAYNKTIIDTVKKIHPDVVFLYRCYHVYVSTLEKIKGKSILMSYNNDDPFSGIPSNGYFRNHIANALLCDLNYVYRKKNIDDYKRIGIINTKILMPYYLSWQNRPIPCKKDIPVVFVGHYEKDGRDIVMKSLIEAGVPIRIYGSISRWMKSPVYHYLKSIIYNEVVGADYNITINRAQIALVFLSKGNSDTYTRRCFEIPAAKTLMMAPYTDDLNNMFPEDMAAVYYRGIDELISKCFFYLSNPKEANRIANNGFFALTQLGGSETKRCEEVLNDYYKLM